MSPFFIAFGKMHLSGFIEIHKWQWLSVAVWRMITIQFFLSLSLSFIIALCISRSLANSLLVLYFLRCACDKTVHYWSLTCFITVSIILHLDLVRSRVWSVFWVQGEEEKRNGILWRHVWLAIFFIYVFRYSLICDDPDSFLLHCTNKCQFIYW